MQKLQLVKETNDLSAAMAVPKKRRSKSKGAGRIARWKGKARKFAQSAISNAKAIGQKARNQNQTVDKEVIKNEIPETKVVNIENKDSKKLDGKTEE